MKFAVVVLLGLSLLHVCQAGMCEGHCNNILDDCGCDILCPLFGDCCDADNIQADCGIDPTATTGELDLSDEIFTEGEFKQRLDCGSDMQDQELSNEGTDIWRMHFTSEDANTDRVTVDVCDHHDNLMVSVMKPLENGNVEDQCGLVRCECTFQPSSAPEVFYIVVYRLEMLDDETDTDLSTDYGLSVTCAAQDTDACAAALDDVKNACPTLEQDSNTCFNFDVAADCCTHFVDYYDQCSEDVSGDAEYSTACRDYPGDTATARRCAADEVVVFDTTYSGLTLAEVTDSFLTAFRKAMAKTLGIDLASVLISDVSESSNKQDGVVIKFTVISDAQTENLDGGALDTSAITSLVENLDQEALAANANEEFEAADVDATVNADDLVVSAPQVEEAVATPSVTPSATPTISLSSSPAVEPSSSAAVTPSSSAAVTPSPDPCVGLEADINSACLTDGCLNSDVAVGDDCCDAVNAYTQDCSGYTFDDSCNNDPGTVVQMYTDNCIGSSTSAASVPAMLAAALLALVAFAVRA